MPSTKVLRAVSAAASAASRPCISAVASVASTFLASLISAPAERREPGDLVHRQQGEQLQEALDVGILGVAPELPVVVRPTASPALSQTAPAAVLPILAPDDVVSSGQVRA